MIASGRLVRRFAVLAALGVIACDRLPQNATKAMNSTNSAIDASLIERGRAVYNFRCYYCHGYAGDGKTLAATYLTSAPRNFIEATAESLPREAIFRAVRDGRPNTAMKGFSAVIPASDIAAVTNFVYQEFVLNKRANTRYHTPENGWPKHERYRSAYPFARGEVALTVAEESLDPELRQGRRLYLSSCISCHDRGKRVEDPVTWDGRALSYPRNNYDHRNPAVDAATSATPFRLHDIAPTLDRPTPSQRLGGEIFQANCAFCHAADGTGKNWIGAFLEPHPRDLTDRTFQARMSRDKYKVAIRDGLAGTSMPAWKSVLTDRQIENLIDYIEVAFVEKK